MAYDSNNPEHKQRNKEYQKEWYLKHKKKHALRTAEQKVKNRLRNREIAENYAKNGCVECEEKDFAALDFDHQEDKKDTISKMIGLPVGLSRLEKELAKCEVVCANCHRKRTAKQQGWYKNKKTKESNDSKNS